MPADETMGAAKKWNPRNKITFGFEVAEDGETLVPSMSERETVDRMLRWRGAGKSYRWIADELNRLGVPWKGGGRWSTQRVQWAIGRHLDDRGGNPFAGIPTQETTPIPLAELQGLMLSGLRAQGRSVGYHTQVKKVFQVLMGNPDLHTSTDLTPAIIPRFTSDMGHLKESSRRTFLYILRRVCVFAVEHGHLGADPFGADPFGGTTLPAVTTAGAKSLNLTKDDVGYILAHLKRGAKDWHGRRLYAAAATVVYTGLFPNEALRLTLDDCNLETRSILVSRRQRFVTGQLRLEPSVNIAPELAEILAAWLPMAGPTYLFPTEDRSAPWIAKGTMYFRALREAGEGCGIAGLTMESLRRFHARAMKSVVTFGKPWKAAERTGLVENPPIRGTITASWAPSRHQADGPPGAPPLSVEDVGRFLVHLWRQSDRWVAHRTFAAVATVVFTGLKRRQVLHLEVEQFDSENNHLRLSNGRPVTLHPALAHILAAWLPRVGSRYLFPNQNRFSPWMAKTNGSRPMGTIQAAARDAGVGHVTFVSLREFWQRNLGRLDEVAAYLADQLPTEDEARSVILHSFNEAPVVLTETVSPLTHAEYNVVRALLRAGSNGLTIPELTAASGHKQPERILRRLIAKEPRWGMVIHFPGAKGRGGLWIGPPAA